MVFSFVTNRILFTLLIYLVFLAIVISFKPKFMFDDNDQLRSFGVDDKSTLFSFGFLSILLPFILYYFFALFDVLFHKKQ